MTDLFHRNPRLTALTVLLLVVSGAASLQRLPRSEDPHLTPRFGIIRTEWPGATAERVEAQLTESIEDEMRAFEEVLDLRSTSRAGYSVVQLELYGGVQDVSEVWARVRDRLAGLRASLPGGAGPPDLADRETGAYSLVAALRWTQAGEAPPALMRRFGEALEDRLRATRGTEFTRCFGAPEEEISVVVRQERLSALGLTVEDLVHALQQAERERPSGELRGIHSRLPLQVEGGQASLRALADVPVSLSAQGGEVRMEDLARIERAPRTPPAEVVISAGLPAVVVAARQAPFLRADRWSREAKAGLQEFERELPPGLELDVLFDQDLYVTQRFDHLWQGLGLGTLAVVAVTFLLMGARAASVVGCVLPLTLCFVLACMQGMGMALHQISVTGLILALGILIDNAIIVVDEVQARMGEGASARQAVREGTRTLWIPLAGSTLTTVLAFLPVLLMPGPTGEFLAPLAGTVILSLVGSLGLSLTVAAALAAWLGPGSRKVHWAARWRPSYEAMLRHVIARPWQSIGLALALPLLGALVMPRLPLQFFPPAERDQVQVQLALSRSSSIQATEEAARRAGAILGQDPEVTDVHWFVGSHAPSFYYNLWVVADASPFFAHALVSLRDGEHTQDVTRRLQDQLDRRLPEAQSLVLQLEQGPPVDAPVEVRLQGPDLDRLVDLAAEARRIVASVPGVIHTRSSLEHGQPKLVLDVDDRQVRESGLDRVRVAEALEASLEGRVATRFHEDTESLPVRVRLSADQRREPGSLDSLTLEGGTSLAALGDFRLVPEWGSITRRNGTRTASVQVFLEAGLLPSVALAQVQERLAREGFELPDGYRAVIGGEAEARDEATTHLLGPALVLAVAMGAVLVLLFQSFSLAAVIAGVALMSPLLASLFLWLGGQPFGFLAVVGCMGLAGLAMNDTIVVLRALRRDPGARRGDVDAVATVVVRSTRHVLTTSATTMAGFAPLALGGGAFWPPLAIVIGGGVLGATLLALLFVPAVFLKLQPVSA